MKHRRKNIFLHFKLITKYVLYVYEDTSLVASVVESLKTSDLVRAAGVATSLTDSGQQW